MDITEVHILIVVRCGLYLHLRPLAARMEKKPYVSVILQTSQLIRIECGIPL